MASQTATRVLAPIGTAGNLFAFGLDVGRQLFRRPFQTREFIQQAWFIASVTIIPTALVAIPFGAVIALQVGGLIKQFGAQSFTGSASVLAVVQTDVKRILAYSSVAHTGFLLTGVLGLQSAGELAEGQVTSLQAVLFYLATYGFATLGAFAVVTVVRDAGGEATALDRWEGLGRRSPLTAGVFAFFLLSMAGIPLTAGV